MSFLKIIINSQQIITNLPDWSNYFIYLFTASCNQNSTMYYSPSTWIEKIHQQNPNVQQQQCKTCCTFPGILAMFNYLCDKLPNQHDTLLLLQKLNKSYELNCTENFTANSIFFEFLDLKLFSV
jgi:hypothetical protein